jgi:hypothetical protein
MYPPHHLPAGSLDARGFEKAVSEELQRVAAKGSA